MVAKAKLLDSDLLADRMRPLLRRGSRVLIANLAGTAEADDPYTVLNCGGFGRIRSFERFGFHAPLGDDIESTRTRAFLMRSDAPIFATQTQVFQLAGCSWRCWYCYVDEDRLSANPRIGSMLSAAELVELYIAETERPQIIDLSGGQPDLLPSWPVEVLRALSSRPECSRVNVRSEDNLTGRLLSEALPSDSLKELIETEFYTRIGCFKGFDEDSFKFNTRSEGRGYERQFVCARDIIDLGIPFFAYATFTGLDLTNIEQKMALFVDNLQRVHHNLPLRVVPLKVTPAAAWSGRELTDHALAESVERAAVDAWVEQICSRYTEAERRVPLSAIALR